MSTLTQTQSSQVQVHFSWAAGLAAERFVPILLSRNNKRRVVVDQKIFSYFRDSACCEKTTRVIVYTRCFRKVNLALGHCTGWYSVHLTGPIDPLCKESGDEQCDFGTVLPFLPKYIYTRLETY